MAPRAPLRCREDFHGARRAQEVALGENKQLFRALGHGGIVRAGGTFDDDIAE